MTAPRSALNLRLVLAAFGLVVCTGLAVVALALGSRPTAVLLLAGAVAAVVDVVVVLRRRRREPGEHRTLFE